MYIRSASKQALAPKRFFKEPDSYEVSVKEEAERNMANKRVIEIVRKMHPGKS